MDHRDLWTTYSLPPFKTNSFQDLDHLLSRKIIKNSRLKCSAKQHRNSDFKPGAITIKIKLLGCGVGFDALKVNFSRLFSRLISHKPMKWKSYTLVVMVVNKSYSRSENLVLS